MAEETFEIQNSIISVKHANEPAILDDIRDKCQNRWEKLQGDIPNTLYHYTSAEGLLGILSSYSIWFTNINYFEDKSEGICGRDLILNIIEDLQDPSHSEEQKLFLDLLRESYQESIDFFKDDIYTTSFCSEANVLSQWERFANRGYCLGLNFTADTVFGYRAGKFNRAQRLDATRVIYEKDKQINLIKPILKELLELISSHEDVRAEYCKTLVNGEITPWLYSFKNDFFQDENEWRFMTDVRGLTQTKNMNSESEHLSFRTDNGTIIPYLSLRILEDDLENPTKFPLSEIFVGPKLSSYSFKSLRYLLKKYNLPMSEIKQSNIPIR